KQAGRGEGQSRIITPADGGSEELQHVTGTVTDASQQPMAGVNIVVKGTTHGTTTDSDGRYAIDAQEDDVLVFSFIGYTAVEMQVATQHVIDIVLTEDIKSLGEVVVNAGYWEVKEKEQTGNISRITAADIQKQPINNPLQSLQGRMPGVYIQQNTGLAGGGFTIQIRGRNSLRDDGNAPLYIIDGVPFTPTALNTIGRSIIGEGNPLSAINPGDIESIEILKDADATAVYGSRGANGVVLITTKRGKPGRVKVDFNFLSGIGQAPSRLDMLNTKEYVMMRREAFTNDNRAMTVQRAPDILVWDTTRHTDWQDALIGGTSHTTNASVAISGGDEQTQFVFNLGYYKETTVFPGDFYFQRLSGGLNLNHGSLNNKFKISSSVNYTAGINNLYSQDLTSTAVTLPPTAPALYDETGDINWEWGSSAIQNPLAWLEKKYKSNQRNLVTNTRLAYELIPGLNVKAALGYTMMQVDEVATNPLSAIPPQFLSDQTGTSNFSDGNITTWIVEPQIDYVRSLGKGTLTVLAGATLQESVQQGETLQATGYTSDALLENVLAATAVEITGVRYMQYRYAALFGRVNYIWDDKYIINVTGRRDGSSRFGPGRQFGNFGAIGAAWIFSNEGFVKDGVPFMTFGKLRASYGTTGSDAIGNYQYLNSYSATTYPYNGTSGLVVTRLENPDYSWETNRKLEFGLDLGFFRDRIMLSASWYRNRSSDQLVGLPLSLVTGQPSVQFNLPATVENRGWELQLTTSNITGSDFTWTTSFNITLPENRLVEFPNLEAFPAYRNMYKVGSSLFLRRTIQFNSVDPATGLYTFVDVNGDGNISSADDGQFLKAVTQKYYGGMMNTLTYRSFQLDFLFQFVKQDGNNYLRSFGAPGSLSNQPDIVLGRWQNPDSGAAGIQRFTSISSLPYNSNRASDNSISDASFIRLKNISLSWQVPEKWTKRTGVARARLFLQGQNIFTITNYLGMDPENQNVLFLPPLRIMAAGFQLTL
ncbi:MAG TPA: TonB-dependent receptor, partial [Ohtaekwangia sp.]|nr:TonB-dependent receptor [Ohtaekwangia sp.]